MSCTQRVQHRRPAGGWLSDAVVAAIAQSSTSAPLAYVETDYFGGVGEQHAVVWEGRRLVLGPLDHDGAINEALVRLGVWTRGGQDAFDALGLGAYRDTETA